jgi:hypothetical protein
MEQQFMKEAGTFEKIKGICPVGPTVFDDRGNSPTLFMVLLPIRWRDQAA